MLCTWVILKPSPCPLVCGKIVFEVLERLGTTALDHRVSLVTQSVKNLQEARVYKNRSYIKISLKWITDININSKFIKLLEGNIGKKSLRSWVNNRFYRHNVKSIIYKRKNYFLFSKIKNFCPSKEDDEKKLLLKGWKEATTKIMKRSWKLGENINKASIWTKVKSKLWFSSSHVWMWMLDHKKGWVPKNSCFWTVGLKKTLESPLSCKEIQPVNPKGNQPWIFIGRIDAEAETPILWPPDAKSWLIRKDPDAGKDWRQEEKGMTEDEMLGWHHWLSGH